MITFLANLVNIGYTKYIQRRSKLKMALERVKELEAVVNAHNKNMAKAKEILDSVVGKPMMARRFYATQPSAKTHYLN